MVITIFCQTQGFAKKKGPKNRWFFVLFLTLFSPHPKCGVLVFRRHSPLRLRLLLLTPHITTSQHNNTTQYNTTHPLLPLSSPHHNVEQHKHNTTCISFSSFTQHIAQHNTTQYNTPQDNTAQHCKHNTTQHNISYLFIYLTIHNTTQPAQHNRTHNTYHTIAQYTTQHSNHNRTHNT